MPQENVSTGGAGAPDSQRDQAGQRSIRVGVDERNLQTAYANGFRTSTTPEEIVLDFGLNLGNPTPGDATKPDVLFVIHSRVVLNYYSAKRLALTLGQHIRRHEELFGELELDAEKRRRAAR